MNSDQKRVLLQLGLFIITFITTTLAGAEWTYGRSIFAPNYSWSDFFSGLEYSIPFLLILTVHEFGHYFVARYHKIKVSLPYYLPMPPMPFSIGTMGALIRLREKVYSKKQNFDIGLAGPLAGFVAALVILFYGFTHLPEPEYIFQIHPEYEQYGLSYADYVYKNQQGKYHSILPLARICCFCFSKILWRIRRGFRTRTRSCITLLFLPAFYPWYLRFLTYCLLVNWTAGMWLMDYSASKLHRIIASVIFVAFLFYAGIGVVTPRDEPESLLYWIPGSIAFLYLALSGLGLPKRDTIMYALIMFAALFVLSWLYPNLQGYSGWLLFGFLIGRFIGIQHPPSEIEEPLDTKRIILGWLCLLIFIICFTPAPLNIAEIIVDQP